MVSYLFLAISAALLVAANATTTTTTMSDEIVAVNATITVPDEIGEQGIFQCLGDLPKLFKCNKEIVGFFRKGKSAIGQKCCEDVLTAAEDCLETVLGFFNIPIELVN